MNTITLNNDIQMPMLGFGTFLMGGAECEESVLTALRSGYRMIDTAEAYGNEEAVGNATVYSDAWNESDRSVLDAVSSLLYLSKMRRNMKKRSACSGKMLHGQFVSTIIRAHGSGS